MDASPTETGFWCEHSFLELNILFVCDYFILLV